MLVRLHIKEYFTIITEYAENGSLQDILTKYLKSDKYIIQTFNNTKLQILLIGISRSMMILSKFNITHGNLNTTNILLDDKFYPYLADFYKSKISKNFNIIPNFIAPEISEKKEFNEKTDVFSFGMIMYALLSQMHPKSNKIFRGLKDSKMPDYISKPFQDLIKKCLSPDQEDRPKFEEIFSKLTYDKKYYLELVDMKELTKYINRISNDLIFCTICNKNIQNNDLLYFSGLPYHKRCVKCSICNKKFNTCDDFVCIGTNLFICPNHQKDSSCSSKLAPFQAEITKNIIRDKFDSPLFTNNNLANYSSEEIFIDSETIESSFQINKPYKSFIPTVTFHFDVSPEEMDFKTLQERLGENAVIINVEKGSTLLTIAFIAADKAPKTIEEFHEFIEPIKDRLESTSGSQIVFNLIDEPKITIPDDKSIAESFNLLQNTKILESIDVDKIKEEVYYSLSKEKEKNKDWKYLFKNKQLYDEVEKEVREQIENNHIEMIITGQTIIVNKYLDEYEKIKQKIPKNKIQESFVYHGSQLSNHQSIIKNHFNMPGKNSNNSNKQRDKGFYGRGIYATDNMFYAAAYANGEFKLLSYNEKAPVILCLSVYNEDYDCDIVDRDKDTDISKRTKSNYGIHHALVGSISNYDPMNESCNDKSFVYATEYVFPNKYQIIPICSFTVKRTNHFILWKDENIDNNENKYYMEVLSHKIEVNVYFKKSVEDALELIELKKRNRFKLITNAGKNLSGQTLIQKARKIVGSNFICLVFAMNLSHLDWVCEMENVLFTDDEDYFRKFAAIEMDEEEIIKFSNELGEKYERKFKINKESMLKFKITRSFK